MTATPPERRGPLERQLALLNEACGQLAVADGDRQAASVPDRAGIGSGRDILVGRADA